MRRITVALLLLPWAVHAQTDDLPRIAELLPDPGDGQREFIELWNPGDAITLDGWRIEDAAGNAFALDGHTISQGGRLVVWGGGEADAWGPAWSKATVWNNGGDTATLHGPDGPVHAFTYGAGGPPAPATGNSLAWDGSGWTEGAPTPGQAPTAGGSVQVEVQDAPPIVRIEAPEQAAPQDTVSVTLHVDEPNGDPVTWRLWSDEALVAEGAEVGTFARSIEAPDAGTWLLRLEATSGEHTATTEHIIAIESAGFQVHFPAGPVTFPELVPGAQAVVATAPFRIDNTGDAATPRIDLSDFHGPESWPVVGRVSIGTGSDGDWTWTAYEGPLTALPVMEAGAGYDVLLRIDDVPLPLAAGAYGTSFTVVP